MVILKSRVPGLLLSPSNPVSLLRARENLNTKEDPLPHGAGLTLNMPPPPDSLKTLSHSPKATHVRRDWLVNALAMCEDKPGCKDCWGQDSYQHARGVPGGTGYLSMGGTPRPPGVLFGPAPACRPSWFPLENGPFGPLVAFGAGRCAIPTLTPDPAQGSKTLHLACPEHPPPPRCKLLAASPTPKQDRCGVGTAPRGGRSTSAP